MIFLDVHNRSLEELLLWKFENAKQGGKHEKTYQIIVDFDDVVYRVHSLPESRSKLAVSIWLVSSQVQQSQVLEYLAKEYGPYLCEQPMEGASVSLVYDLDSLPDDYARLAQQASMLRRHCFAGLFNRFLEFHALGDEASGVLSGVIHHRFGESIFVQSQGDRVTVIFSTVFKDPNDSVLSKVFLQELTEVRRRVDRAPQVFFSQTTPPSELLGTDAIMGENVSYITFVFFSRHLTPTAAPRTINLIYSFRTYLHYHVQCAKSYTHRRAHAKTAELMKILNRARPDYLSVPVVQIDDSPLAIRVVSTAGLPNGPSMDKCEGDTTTVGLMSPSVEPTNNYVNGDSI